MNLFKESNQIVLTLSEKELAALFLIVDFAVETVGKIETLNDEPNPDKMYMEEFQYKLRNAYIKERL